MFESGRTHSFPLLALLAHVRTFIYTFKGMDGEANREALSKVEKITESEPAKGEELLESEELKRKLSEAEERLRSGLSPKKAKSKSR